MNWKLWSLLISDFSWPQTATYFQDSGTIGHTSGCVVQGVMSSLVTMPDRSSAPRSLADGRAPRWNISGQRPMVCSGTRSRGSPRSNDDDFFLKLSAVIQGFGMLDKRWRLISALVQNKIDSDQGIDVVEGKGTGLVLLAPGTGKTLTAESVAEIAQKTLYRVTCGDIGTKPEEVEKIRSSSSHTMHQAKCRIQYLDSVFLLGRRWGCVVLLDEVDVFLEKRSLWSGMLWYQFSCARWSIAMEF
ncbi:hypothetical protein BST61_g2631 [Cercospora zeina]